MNRIIITLLTCVILFSGCSRNGHVQLEYPTAPLVTIPAEIKSIAVVNRSLTATDRQKAKTAEAVLTGEVAGSDKRASDHCIQAVFDRINGWHDIKVVIPSVTRYEGTGTGDVPELMNWNTVQQICDSNGTDALLVLESFDSNSDIIASVITRGMGDILNGKVPDVTAPAQIRMNVVSFWRLYYPATREIIDQYRHTDYMTFDAGGLAVPVPPPDALHRVAYMAGTQYIERLLPGYYTVKREMYKTGTRPLRNEFKAAFRRAEVANWDEAISLWEKLEKKSKTKNAGMACVNIAAGYEVKGDFQKAFEWAKKSYEDYGNKTGREYANQLKYRLTIE